MPGASGPHFLDALSLHFLAGAFRAARPAPNVLRPAAAAARCRRPGTGYAGSAAAKGASLRRSFAVEPELLPPGQLPPACAAAGGLLGE